MRPFAYDVIVVGAGMAGLTAASYLSRARLKVLLCEKEKTTGGLVNSFGYKGFVFDGGIRSTEDSGIVTPRLRQLGLPVDFLPSPVSIGIGQDVVWVEGKASLTSYQEPRRSLLASRPTGPTSRIGSGGTWNSPRTKYRSLC